MNRTTLFASAVAATALVMGCSRPPQVSPANFRLISSLRTATSSEQIDWVEETAKQVEEGKGKGAISDVEYEEFQSIIRLAREGKWKEAEAETVRLGKGQKTTAAPSG